MFALQPSGRTGGGGGGSKGGKTFDQAIQDVAALMFDPKLSIERFRGDFDTPKKVLSCLQSLLVVVLGTSPPLADDAGSAYSVYWERFYAHLECKRAAGGNLLERLFDCLDSLAPCSAACPCSQQAAGAETAATNVVHIGLGERVLMLDVSGMTCADGVSEQGDRVNPRLAMCEAMQFQVEVLLTIVGIVRAIPKAMEGRKEGRGGGGGPLVVEGRHEELGMFAMVAARLLQPSGHSGVGTASVAAEPLLKRLTNLSTCMSYDGYSPPGPSEEDTLMQCLAAKVRDAVGLLIACSLEDVEGSTWSGSELPNWVVLPLLASRFMVEVMGGDQAHDDIMSALEELAAAKRDSGPMLGSKAQLMTTRLLGDEKTAEVLFRSLECVTEMVSGGWLLSRTSGEQGMPWASEWEETVHGQARQALFQAIGTMCLALRHMQTNCPGSFERFEDALLRMVDETLRAVLSGWDEHIFLLPCCDLLRGSGAPFKQDSFHGGMRWLMATCRLRREDLGGSGVCRMHAVLLMSEALAHLEDARDTQYGTDYNQLLLHSAADLCRRLPQLDADSRSPGRLTAGPHPEVMESLMTVRFCFRYMEQAADIQGLESSLGGLLSSSLCLLSVLGTRQFIATAANGSSDVERQRNDTARSDWQAVAACALDCIGYYAWHSEISGAHQLAVHMVSLVTGHLESAAASSQLGASQAPFSPAAGGLSLLFAHVLVREGEDPVLRMPITKALLSLMERVLDAFDKHFGAAAGLGDEAQQLGSESTPSLHSHWTNAAITLAKVEDVRQDPNKMQRNEWKTTSTGAASGQPVWGWSTSYSTSTHTSSVAFHLLVPLVHFAMQHLLTLSAEFRAWSCGDIMRDKAYSYQLYSQATLSAERSRDPLWAFNSTIRLLNRFLSDEVLMLSLLRTETFLQRSSSAIMQTAHVGCAGLQDRQDVFLFVFHWLERESGPVTHLLKFMEMRAAQEGSIHKGMDASMQGVLCLLRHMLLYRCDKHVACSGASLERAALQLAPAAVACMCLAPRSLAMPSLVLGDDGESALSREASRLLSVICRIGLQPLTIRQSWGYYRRDLAQQQRRTLLEMATCSEAAVDSRASVLAFLSEALLSQPGLADWLFEDESDHSTAVGRADAAGACSITLDSSASSEDGYYKGWVLEVRGGKGLGQLPRVVKAYSGCTREAKLSAPWDTKMDVPDGTSQYTLCRQLELRRVVKAFLHPDFSYTGGAVGSEKEANRLKVVQHTLILVHTIWDSVPEERASVVQGFCDPDCLIFGLESPDDAEVLNETSRWRTYNVRMHAPGGKRRSAGVFAAPGEPLIQQGRKGQDSASGKKLCLAPPSDESKALGWLKARGDPSAPSSPGFWQVVSRWVLGAPHECDVGGGTFMVDGEGRTTVRCKMPSSLRRQPLPLLDGSRSNSALIRVLASQDTLSRILRVRSHVRGRLAREVWDAMADVSADREACVERVRAELRLADSCMQELESLGYDRSESADAALAQMWERLPHKLLFSDMDGEREKALRPVPLPYMLRNYVYASVVSSRTGAGGNDDEEIISLFESPQGPLSYAVDSMCRRMHIEACAVSIAAIHLEQDPLPHAQGAEATKSEAAKQQEELVTKVAGKAVRVICGMRWAGLPEVSDEGMLLDSEQSWKDGPPLEVLKFVEKISLVVPRGQDTLTHAQQVDSKLALLYDFSEEWHLDSKRARAMSGPVMEEVAQAINRDKAVDDLSGVLAAAYCRFLMAAACTCPGNLLRALDQGRGTDAGGKRGQRCPLNPLLIALARALPIGALSRDLEVAGCVARTLSMLVHMAWPLHPTRHQEMFPSVPAPLLLASLADALSAAVHSEKRLPRLGAEQASQALAFCEGMLDCLLRLILYMLDMRAALDSLGRKQEGSGGQQLEQADVQEAADLLGSADKDPGLLLRLSSAVGSFMRGQTNGGLIARKCCSILALLVRICPWTEGHWEAVLDQTFWTQAPGILRWIGGDIESKGMDATGHKEAALDVMAAFELIVEVTKRDEGAVLLSGNSIMTFLRQGPLDTRVSRPDAQQLRFYVPSGNRRQRNRWHQVWCQALQAIHLLTVKLAHSDAHMSELVAFAVTNTDRLTKVLTVTCQLYRDSAARGDTHTSHSEQSGSGLVAGMRSSGLTSQQLVDAELGRVPSFAVLEEARLWSALMLRLSHRFNVWANHVPLLARVVLELVPEVVSSLTYILNLWASDTAAFERRLEPVSEQERQQARTVFEQGGSGQRPCGEAVSVLDQPIQAAIQKLTATYSKDARSRTRFEHQRSVYNQRLLDTLFSLLHNCLRIMCACGQKVQPHIEASMSRWGSGATSSLTDWQVAHTSIASGPRRGGCSLGSIVAAADAAVTYLSFVVHVEWACDSNTGGEAGKVRGGEWQDEVGALQHRRAMLLRLIECAGLLVGRFAGDVDLSDACGDLLHRLKTCCTTPTSLQVGNWNASKHSRDGNADIERTLSTLRSAMRNIFETL